MTFINCENASSIFIMVMNFSSWIYNKIHLHSTDQYDLMLRQFHNSRHLFDNEPFQNKYFLNI